MDAGGFETAFSTRSIPLVRTSVVAFTLLLPGLGSASGAEMLAVVTRVPAVVGRTMTVMVAVAPTDSVPGAHVTVLPDRVHEPSVDDAETNVTPDGNCCSTATELAALGPRLLAISV